MDISICRLASIVVVVLLGLVPSLWQGLGKPRVTFLLLKNLPCLGDGHDSSSPGCLLSLVVVDMSYLQGIRRLKQTCKFCFEFNAHVTYSHGSDITSIAKDLD